MGPALTNTPLLWSTKKNKQLKDEQHSLKASLVVLQQLLTQTLTTSGVVSGGVTVASITSPRLLEIN